IFMIRKCFSESAKAKRPDSWFGQCFLEVHSYSDFFRTPLISLPASAALVTESAQIVPFVISYIPELWNIKTVGSSSEIIFIIKTFNHTTGTYTQVMVHDIMPQ